LLSDILGLNGGTIFRGSDLLSSLVTQARAGQPDAASLP
jgi:hypothetical protein